MSATQFAFSPTLAPVPFFPLRVKKVVAFRRPRRYPEYIASDYSIGPLFILVKRPDRPSDTGA